MRTKSLGLASLALAVAITPVIASAANPENTTVTATIGSTISMTGTTAISLALTPTSGSVQSIQSGTYTVSTNNSSGYTLAIKDSDATLNLTAAGGTITPGTGNVTTPAALTDGRWGWAVSGAPFDVIGNYPVGNNDATPAGTFAGITASDVTLKTTSSTASNDATIIYFGARVGQTQPTGSYTDSVVLTATARP